MGKGDKRTKRGKITVKSYGNSRPKQNKIEKKNKQRAEAVLCLISCLLSGDRRHFFGIKKQE